MREDLALGHEGRRGDLRDHQARVEAALLHEEGRQVRQRRVDELLDPPLRDRGEVRRRDRGVVEDQPDRRAVEVPSRDDVAPRRRRPAGCRSSCSSRAREPPARGRRRRAPRRAPAACSAGRSCPGPGRSRGGTRGSRFRRAAPRRLAALCSAPGCGRAPTMRRSKAASEPRAASSDAAPTRSADAGERERAVEREAADGDRHLDAVDQREPLLGGEGHGPEPRRLSAAAAGFSRPRTRTRPSPISPSARCESGARSPEAPDRALRGNRPAGCRPRASRGASRPSTRGCRSCRARARWRAGPSSRAPPSSGSGAPTPAQWLRMRLRCRLSMLRGGNRDVGELPEARRHAVDRRTLERTARSTTRREAAIARRAEGESVTRAARRATAATSSRVRPSPASRMIFIGGRF